MLTRAGIRTKVQIWEGAVRPTLGQPAQTINAT